MLLNTRIIRAYQDLARAVWNDNGLNTLLVILLEHLLFKFGVKVGIEQDR